MVVPGTAVAVVFDGHEQLWLFRCELKPAGATVQLRPVSIAAARCVAWRAIVSDSYRVKAR